MIVAGGETRRVADRAVDVEHCAAVSTDQVMVIVANAVFVTRNRSGRLNAPGPHCVGDLFGRGVRVRGNGSGDGQTLRSHLQSGVAKLLLRIPAHFGHSITFSVLSQEFDSVKNKLPRASILETLCCACDLVQPQPDFCGYSVNRMDSSSAPGSFALELLR